MGCLKLTILEQNFTHLRVVQRNCLTVSNRKDSYGWNNLIRFFDPDGRQGEGVENDYGLDKKVRVSLLRKNENMINRLNIIYIDHMFQNLIDSNTVLGKINLIQKKYYHGKIYTLYSFIRFCI